MKIIAIANSKGGVGRTTVAMVVASLMHRRGKRVVVFDMSTNQKATTWKQECTEDYPPVPFSVIPLLDLSAHQIKANVTSESNFYDCAILDTTADPLNISLSSALALADHLICPISLGGLELDAMPDFVAQIRAINTTRSAKHQLVGHVLLNTVKKSIEDDFFTELNSQAVKNTPELKMLKTYFPDRKYFYNLHEARTWTEGFKKPEGMTKLLDNLDSELKKILKV